MTRLVLTLALLLPLAAPAQAPADPAALATPVNGKHTLNLKDADIRVLVATVSESTGRNFIIDPRVEGKVNVVSTQPMDPDEVYAVFESVLRVHGFAAVESGRMVKIVPEVIANQDGSTLAGAGGPDSIVTRVIPLRHVAAAELIPILRPWPSAQRRGVQLRTNCCVKEITLGPYGLADGVLYFDESGTLQEQKAEMVVIACNGVGTPRLLLNSKSERFPIGLANSSGLVGKNLMFHLPPHS